MSARCGILFSGYGLDDEPCGEPADAICQDCEKPVCLEHELRSESGHAECRSCRAERRVRVAIEKARRTS